jgi:sterol desaturase/sphingolipid hydroxylase (fatty acid hydroxylase superfamily)
MLVPLWSIPVIAAILWLARFYEKRVPVEREQSSAAVIADWKLAYLRIGISQLLFPITGASAIIIVNAAGGGWIHLRSDGWWFPCSVLIVLLASDFWGYLVHRAQHKIPVLWAMHSLHHSAEALSIITGARHFWLEDAINTAVVFSVLPIIFKIPLEVVTTVTVLTIIPEALTHMNTRLSLGRFALCLNNPQYHRIHHSIEPQHMIFGTAWKPGKDEFPKTGLMPRETASGFLDGIIWPVRHRLPVQRMNRLLLQTGGNTACLIPRI